MKGVQESIQCLYFASIKGILFEVANLTTFFSVLKLCEKTSSQPESLVV